MIHALADVREHEVMEPYCALWELATEVLLEPWRVRGRRRALLRARIALVLSFDTWRQLVREQGLSEEQAIELGLRPQVMRGVRTTPPLPRRPLEPRLGCSPRNRSPR